ncbi:hypothetical protein F7725_001824 [Dissostichus mawsoni]|uniref:FBXO47 ARM repeats region domain-containing protein n=1 Tax=Dissostichus mawsoni TaxID=36200 RepID=A0A7J5Y0P3_DISMA|nr:hypothetical protein F7725_001824 [Dissostichus mawsoni]
MTSLVVQDTVIRQSRPAQMKQTPPLSTRGDFITEWRAKRVHFIPITDTREASTEVTQESTMSARAAWWGERQYFNIGIKYIISYHIRSSRSVHLTLVNARTVPHTLHPQAFHVGGGYDDVGAHVGRAAPVGEHRCDNSSYQTQQPQEVAEELNRHARHDSLARTICKKCWEVHIDPQITKEEYSPAPAAAHQDHRDPQPVPNRRLLLPQAPVRVLEISIFSMVSKKITRSVVEYISTLAWKNKTIIQSFHHSTCPEQRSTIGHYRDLGSLLPVGAVLETRLRWLPQLRSLPPGWDELECHRVFNFVCDLTNLLQKIEIVVTGNPGVFNVLLDPWSNQMDTQFWLMQLLKPWPLVSQAHLLLTLYGPLLPEGTLGWQDLVERGLPHSALWDLARAILLLFSKLEVKGQNTNSLVAIFKELIVIPQPWHVENVARLLVLCGSSLCYTVLASKAVNGRLLEISRLIVYIILVCEKDGYHMSWAVKMVQNLCKVFSTPPERFGFIQQLENMFQMKPTRGQGDFPEPVHPPGLQRSLPL